MGPSSRCANKGEARKGDARSSEEKTWKRRKKKDSTQNGKVGGKNTQSLP